MELLRLKCLTVKMAKCKFARQHLEFLGHEIGAGVLKPQVVKVKAIQEFPTPESKHQLRSFLGITGYYRKFIPQYATVAAPLSTLTKKEIAEPLPWEEEHVLAFEKLKQLLATAPVLHAPDYSQPFQLSTDASGVGIGSVLEQQREDTWVPLAYFSRKLLPWEARYTVTELEALAIVDSVQHFTVYLLGARFHVMTDHRALAFLPTMNQGGPRLVRWALALQPFDFTISYRKGKDNAVADGLSRCPHPGDKPLQDDLEVSTLTVVSEGGGDVVPNTTLTSAGTSTPTQPTTDPKSATKKPSHSASRSRPGHRKTSKKRGVAY